MVTQEGAEGPHRLVAAVKRRVSLPLGSIGQTERTGPAGEDDRRPRTETLDQDSMELTPAWTSYSFPSSLIV